MDSISDISAMGLFWIKIILRATATTKTIPRSPSWVKYFCL
jgi:hypothetical protein